MGMILEVFPELIAYSKTGLSHRDAHI